MITIEQKKHFENTEIIVNYIMTMIRKYGYIVQNIQVVTIRQLNTQTVLRIDGMR